MTSTPRPLPDGLLADDERVLMVVGSYGSGKTEVAVNLAVALAATGGRRVQIADLDLVNPYFRCREARALMERYGVRVVVPPGAQAFADLPIMLPEVRGMLRPLDDVVSLFDVGGDDVGARALASLRQDIRDGAYELWQVVNARRPFTGTVDGCISALRSIEKASRLSMTGLLVNTHLIDHTTPDVVRDGWLVAREVADRTDLPIRCVCVMDELADAPELADVDVPLLRLTRHMLPPWIVRGTAPPADDAPLPAARPNPIGEPGPIPVGHPGGTDDGQD